MQAVRTLPTCPLVSVLEVISARAGDLDAGCKQVPGKSCRFLLSLWHQEPDFGFGFPTPTHASPFHVAVVGALVQAGYYVACDTTLASPQANKKAFTCLCRP